jgi:isoamylase
VTTRHVIFNAYWEPLTFELPPVAAERGQVWRRCIDTALASPDDIRTLDTAPAVGEATYVVQPRSVVALALALEGVTEKTQQVTTRNDDPSARR